MTTHLTLLPTRALISRSFTWGLLTTSSIRPMKNVFASFSRGGISKQSIFCVASFEHFHRKVFPNAQRQVATGSDQRFPEFESGDDMDDCDEEN
jgi:hypothetical protein